MSFEKNNPNFESLVFNTLAILHNTHNLSDSQGELTNKTCFREAISFPTSCSAVYFPSPQEAAAELLNRFGKPWELTFDECLNHFLVTHLTGSEEWGVFHHIQGIYLCFVLQQQLHCADMARKGSSV